MMKRTGHLDHVPAAAVPGLVVKLLADFLTQPATRKPKRRPVKR